MRNKYYKSKARILVKRHIPEMKICHNLKPFFTQKTYFRISTYIERQIPIKKLAELKVKLFGQTTLF
jgi:hypothetical protein